MKKLKLTPTIKKAIYGVLTALVALAAAVLGLTACSATRTITSTAETYQKGDTSVIIQTKTIENYTATKLK